MSFTETGTTVKEEGVITVTRGFNDATGGGDSDVVVGADNEIIDGVFGVEAGFLGFLAGGKTFFSGGEFFIDLGRSGDFTGSDFGFNFGLDHKIYGVNFDVIIFKCSSDEIEIAVAELLNIKGVFNSYYYITVGVFDDGCVLEPG